MTEIEPCRIEKNFAVSCAIDSLISIHSCPFDVISINGHQELSFSASPHHYEFDRSMQALDSDLGELITFSFLLTLLKTPVEACYAMLASRWISNPFPEPFSETQKHKIKV